MSQRWLWMFLVLLGCPNLASAEEDSGIPDTIVLNKGVNERFPPRIADWLWTNPDYNGFVNEKLRDAVERDIRLFEALRGQGGAAEERFDELEGQIAGALSHRFTTRDLTRGREVLRHDKEQMSLAAVIDPKFKPESVKTIQRALELYLRFAADKTVIQSAIDASIDDPTPQPEKFELKDGKPVLDKYGNKRISAEYAFMRECRVRPPSAEHLQRELKTIFPAATDDPGLIVVCHCADDQWWGGGYIGFAHKKYFHLQRETPGRGYAYIRLNEDKMAASEAHHDDPAFWAGKVAHEVLHNLYYWHPGYESPRHRDEHNQGTKQAFIVAYERAVAEAAAKSLSK